MKDKVKDVESIKEFEENGYSHDEIEGMTDEEFVYTAVGLVNGKSKEEIDEELGKER